METALSQHQHNPLVAMAQWSTQRLPPLAALANKGLQDLLDPPVMLESKAAMEATDKMAMMVVMEMCSRAPFPTSHVSSAHQAHPAIKALLGKKVLADPKEALARMAKMETREMLVCKDPLGCKGQWVHLVLEGQSVHQEDSSKLTAPPAHKEPPERQEPQAKRECPAKMEQIPAAELDLQEIMEAQDHREHLDLKDHLVHKGPMESPAAASIAHSHVSHPAIKSDSTPPGY